MSENLKPRPKLIALCDDPQKQTGFGRVSSNLLKHWHESGFFEQIWVWGIGFAGFPHDLPYRICPAAVCSYPHWNQKENLERFFKSLQLADIGGTPGGFTHLWMMHDTFALNPLSEGLRALASDLGIQTSLYFPVDAPLEAEWSGVVASVTNPVAYCKYGLDQVTAALEASGSARSLKTLPRLRVLPHGVDSETYHPIERFDGHTRAQARELTWSGKVKEGDFLMLSVGQNQKRKGHHLSLQTLAVLKRVAPEIRPKLHMHMNSKNLAEGVDLAVVARGLGLVVGEDVFFADSVFLNGHSSVNEEQLNGFYNIADLLLTTTYGEGWGLPITEAMAAGLPVCGPDHSAVRELLGADRPEESRLGLIYATRGFEVLLGDNSRNRPRPCPQSAAEAILTALRAEEGSPFTLAAHAARAREFYTSGAFDWKLIAEDWLRLFKRV